MLNELKKKRREFHNLFMDGWKECPVSFKNIPFKVLNQI